MSRDVSQLPFALLALCFEPPGKPRQFATSRNTRRLTRMAVDANGSSCASVMNACRTEAVTSSLTSSSLRSNATAHRAYSRESVVSKTPGSSVHTIEGWPTACTCPTWCLRARLTHPPSQFSSYGTLSVTTLLETQISMGISDRRSAEPRSGSRDVYTQCPKRSGANAIIAASSAPVPRISPQCSVTGSFRCRARRSAGSNDFQCPAGFRRGRRRTRPRPRPSETRELHRLDSLLRRLPPVDAQYEPGADGERFKRRCVGRRIGRRARFPLVVVAPRLLCA